MLQTTLVPSSLPDRFETRSNPNQWTWTLDQKGEKDVFLDQLGEVLHRNRLAKSSTTVSDKKISILLATEKDATSWSTIRHSYEWVIVTTFLIILFLGAAGWTWKKLRNPEQRMKAHKTVEMKNLDNNSTET